MDEKKTIGSFAIPGKGSELARRILAERPEIAARRTEFGRICAIREWIYANAVVAVRSRCLDRDTLDIHNKKAEELLALMHAGAGGFFCGGVARFATKIYALFGIQAYDINIGIAGSETTHVVNIIPVALEEGKEPVYTVQDAYLDYALIGADGKPLDLRDVVSRLERGEGESVIASGDGGGLRPVLVPPPDTPEGADLHPFFRDAIRTARRADRLPNGATLHWTPIMHPCLFEQAPYYAAQYQEPLRRLFGEVSVLNLLRLPLSTSGEAEIMEVVFGGRAPRGDVAKAGGGTDGS